MHFLAESLTGEITLMFISYLIFCTVLMYLFVKTDREWGQLEVSLDDVGQREPHAMATTMRYTALAADDRSLFNNGLTRPSLQHCAQYHDIDCTCFMQAQKPMN
ncbi:hypothetical protein RB25_25520 [Herbaspirillum rubrisubalbicans]|jgi:hypothetical protein|uniref:Uncharacterized protein n=2 Tax=Herbaspirillum rubrisubalbicans TaxID=80842 RepID=A0ABX9BUM6_9BURK|nr:MULTISPECIES: hypothetical protein [Herbaspirillum]MCP1573558.1 hypothetical protein [Herbaspirillum rubrisubalbicans]NQE47842.1 hypothetical protein [Herbaspirillum rubrisubalbicans]QJQ02044.1 hypothetical protein C798_17950 [Herbaspirillum rubrisubalbicans Os34]RAM61434.1 hypothetical protein RB24_25250 [Herbaspirillum rubrisubalbicans]RAN42646.1 hypothetical protein RB25_25520 [Herbaspirillum rubrisubalbicans]